MFHLYIEYWVFLDFLCGATVFLTPHPDSLTPHPVSLTPPPCFLTPFFSSPPDFFNPSALFL